MTFKSPFDSKIVDAENEVKNLAYQLSVLQARYQMFTSFIQPLDPRVCEAKSEMEKVKQQLHDARDVLKSLEEAKEKYVQEKKEELQKLLEEFHQSYRHLNRRWLVNHM